MAAFTTLDLMALLWFAAIWVGYGVLVEKTRFGERSLTAAMNAERVKWMETMVERENRIVDTSIMTGLQQGTAFFASTSLLAIGGALALMRASEEAMAITAYLPLSLPTSRAVWELKVFGLAVIFVYAFFKFAWAYRVFNYAAIMMGAVMHEEGSRERMLAQAHKAAAMQIAASGHFNRGLRAFFFALGYLGWFMGPVVLILTTAGVALVLYRRQFASTALAAVRG